MVNGVQAKVKPGGLDVAPSSEDGASHGGEPPGGSMSVWAPLDKLLYQCHVTSYNKYHIYIYT